MPTEIHYRPLLTVQQLAESQGINFKCSQEKFPDLLQWANRIKDFLSVENFVGSEADHVHTQLVHMASNASLLCTILDFQLLHFQGLAFLRVAIDAVMQMAMLESGDERTRIRRRDIWLTHSQTPPGMKGYKDALRQFQSSFSKRFAEDLEPLVSRGAQTSMELMFSYASYAGSHPSVMKGMLSLEADDGKILSGFFETPEHPDSLDLAVSIGMDLNAFMELAGIQTRVLESIGQKLRRGSEMWKRVQFDWKMYTEEHRLDWSERLAAWQTKGDKTPKRTDKGCNT